MGDEHLRKRAISSGSATLYLVDFNAREAQLSTCLLTKFSMGWLWHRRLSHVGMKRLNRLVKHDLVRGLKDVCLRKIAL